MIQIRMGFTFLNDKEMSILSDLIKETEVRFLIFWMDQVEIFDVKKISNEYVATTELGTGPFLLHIYEFLDHAKLFSTAVVLKERNLDSLEDLTQFLEIVSSAR